MKKPKTPEPSELAKLTVGEVLELFRKNLTAIRDWYRNAKHSGQNVGHVVASELILTNVVVALELAVEGKEWIQPKEGP